MSSTVVLIAILAVAWGAFVVFMQRRISVVPVVPFVPAVLLGLGLLLNHWVDWSGTIVVAALHVVVPAILAIVWRFQRRYPTSRSENGPQ